MEAHSDRSGLGGGGRRYTTQFRLDFHSRPWMLELCLPIRTGLDVQVSAHYHRRSSTGKLGVVIVLIVAQDVRSTGQTASISTHITAIEISRALRDVL